MNYNKTTTITRIITRSPTSFEMNYLVLVSDVKLKCLFLFYLLFTFYFLFNKRYRCHVRFIIVTWSLILLYKERDKNKVRSFI